MWWGRRELFLGVTSFTPDLFPSLKEFQPKEYIKQRGSEKRIFQVRSAVEGP